MSSLTRYHSQAMIASLAIVIGVVTGPAIADDEAAAAGDASDAARAAAQANNPSSLAVQ